RCSDPIVGDRRSLAISCAWTTTTRARFVNLSNISPAPQIPNRRYFLCTACLLTRSACAICCQDQPWARALPTCSPSSDSSSPRRDATAASPTAGSLLDAAAATCVASVMPSTYVDRVLVSTKVDSAMLAG